MRRSASCPHVRTACIQLMGQIKANLGGGSLVQLQPPTRATDLALPTHPNRTPLVSILVINRDGASLLDRMLRSFSKVNSYQPFEFVVVDNGSTDTSSEVLRKWKQRLPLRCISYNENKSFSYANNRAAEHASGELL